MRRREFIALASGGVILSVAARAQRSAMPVLGILNGQSAAGFSDNLAALREGLSESGYVEGQNLHIEYRFAEGHDDQLGALAADLVQRQVDVIVSGGSAKSSLAAKAATPTIPIVFTFGADPVAFGLVASLNRPGGNMTGIANLLNHLVAKRLELLRALVPKAKEMAALVNLNNTDAGPKRKELEQAAQSLGVQIQLLGVRTENDIDSAMATLNDVSNGALFVDADPFFLNHRGKIIALAARHLVPASYETRAYVNDGGLMSYGPRLTDIYRQAGVYAGRILNGEKPADLPVLEPTKFELSLNMKTAKALGLSIPPTLLAVADEVIE